MACLYGKLIFSLDCTYLEKIINQYNNLISINSNDINKKINGVYMSTVYNHLKKSIFCTFLNHHTL